MHDLTINNAIINISRRKLRKEDTASQNITKMVLFMLCLYYVGYFPYILYISIKFFHIPNSISYSIFFFISIFAKDFAKGSTIFIYYKFNKQYRKIFRKYFKNCKNNE